ncbi:UNVERIFIED_CONTAM: Gamma carbonic anhydrase-like 2, mitochondrial, partial [Sesamum latifolium]
MATLARISRRILTQTRSGPLMGRAFSAEAVQSAQPSAPVIRESADRVRWDYRGQGRSYHWASGHPKSRWMLTWLRMLFWPVRWWSMTAPVWNGAVLRGDLNKITIGFCSNVQERCVVHAAWSSPQ